MTLETNNEKRKNRWANDSIASKSVIIILMILLLQLPTALIKRMIDERDGLREQTVTEVSSKWANEQELIGPILSIPVYYNKMNDDKELNTVKTYFHLMPEDLNIDGSVDTETLKRGIYEVVVYNSFLDFKGHFEWSDRINYFENIKSIDYDNALLTIGISDLRGLRDRVRPVWNGETLSVESGSIFPSIIKSGITVQLPNIASIVEEGAAFNFKLNLQGSKQLSFVPIGKLTTTTLDSPWSSPSFNGSFLPYDRNLTDDGFTAEWKVLQLNRSIPQSFWGSGKQPSLTQSNYGVELMMPLDDYQKSMRSVKYGLLTIALTFLVFFLVEVLNKQRIHPFQYGLVGLALCLFYVLLLSISEQLNFNIAYVISTFGIVTMIAMYSLSIFNLKKITGILILVMSSVYSFLFVILQLADYALLMGSVGLTIILGLTMYLTRNINWYSDKGGDQ